MLEELEEIVKRMRIKEVFTDGNDEPVSSSHFLETDRRGFAEVRLEHETAALSDKPIARLLRNKSIASSGR